MDKSIFYHGTTTIPEYIFVSKRMIVNKIHLNELLVNSSSIALFRYIPHNNTP